MVDDKVETAGPGGGEWLAHLPPGEQRREPHLLVDHLESVARRAAEFACPFGGEEWARLAGLWHDVGKFSREFQNYLRAGGDYHAAELGATEGGAPARGSVDHSTAGAKLAVGKLKPLGFLLAFVIAGHHAGLLDSIGSGASLERRLAKDVPDFGAFREYLRRDERLPLVPQVEKALRKRGERPTEAAFSIALFVRMLFSCLVDADFLDTESYMDPERAAIRPRWPADVLARMRRALANHVRQLGTDDSPVNRERRRVREQCVRAAVLEPGLFSLTVPTGGGKTLSSLAFALEHALRHGLRRIIYVIPFTSIIEQNADVFRKVMAPLVEEGMPDPVLEHHSAVDAGCETIASRLAAENWDAPLVVTTAVQFYESLFAARPRRCRKLHNIAGSVVILDEVQKIPVRLLAPCLAALRELATNYRCSVVLCTATQPALVQRDGFPIGLEGVREIVDDPPALHRRLRRTRIRLLGHLGDEELVRELRERRQVLCIVNTRSHAATLYGRLRDDEGVFHLSAAMCPAHRAEVLDRIRGALERGEPCRVVSTQLVEAGVDVDFPVVYRSMAGIDSIAQASGRCNRNGRRTAGDVFVFRSEHPGKEAFLRETVDAAIQVLDVLREREPDPDPLAPGAVEEYFRQLFWKARHEWDAAGVMQRFRIESTREDMPFLFEFREAAKDFRLIDSTGGPVIVPWGAEGETLCRRLRCAGELAPSSLLRRLQRYTVQVPRRAWERAVSRGIVELLHERYPVLVSADLYYDESLGLVLDREDFASADFIQ